MEKVPCVYILAKASHSTLYTGVTSDLPGRVWQHREGLVRGFTKRYGIKRLVWFERHETMESAIRARNGSSGGHAPGNMSLFTRTIQPGAILPRTSDFLP